ncbi:hypothetical protein HYZ06_01845 [Candidatus Daviesbacteria bacterium]|nr:hypothetical protein [Candidatus Daviesbacteria bacterium]
MALVLFIFTLLVYSISNRGEGAQWNHFVYLADAFLHGRLYIPNILTELVSWGGHYFVVYPPMPAILLMPFVAIFGTNFYQPILSILLGAANVSISYIVLVKLFKNDRLALWISILYAFGTIQWYHAEVGSSWYVAHIVALFFLWLALLEIVTKQRLFLIGLFIGGAYLARLPTVLAIIFALIFLKERFLTGKSINQVHIRNFCFLFLGLMPALIFNGFYNFFRFGKFDDYAYSLYLSSNSLAIKQSVFSHGFFSIQYIPERIKDILFSFPVFTTHPPFIVPSLYAMALYIVTPAFFLILFASFKKRLIYSSLITVLMILFPILMKGGNGFTQFGFRYSLDFLPYLLILTASGLKNRFNLYSKLLIIFSILINLWGVIMISFLNLWKIPKF